MASFRQSHSKEPPKEPLPQYWNVLLLALSFLSALVLVLLDVFPKIIEAIPYLEFFNWSVNISAAIFFGVIFFVIALFTSLTISYILLKNTSYQTRLLLIVGILILCGGLYFWYLILPDYNAAHSCSRIAKYRVKRIAKLKPSNAEFQKSASGFYLINDPAYTDQYLMCLKEKGSKDRRVIEYKTPKYLLE